MASLDIAQMRLYLNRSLASANQNKLRGLLAEIDFRRHLTDLGFAGRISPGGWIARSHGAATFAEETVVFFPETILPAVDYDAARTPSAAPHALHTIASTFHQTGINAYYCVPDVLIPNDRLSVRWRATQLGLPTVQPFADFPALITGFRDRTRPFQYLRNNTDTATIPDEYIPEEFSKENVRIAFQSPRFSEVSDVDGIFWGRQYTYPLEIKEKTAVEDNDVGEYFGLDVGPFVKLSYYAAKRGNLHSLFVVREITDPETRELRQWLAVTHDTLAQYASWVPRAGGTNMRGGASSVVRIPKRKFSTLDADFLAAL